MKLLLKFLVAVVLFAQVVRADWLLLWEPEGLVAEMGGWPNPWKPAGVAKNVELRGGMDLGPGLRMGSLNNAWGSSADFTAGSRRVAELSGQYFTFEVAPASGHVLELFALEMNVRLTSAALEGGVWYVWEYSMRGLPFAAIGEPVLLSTATGAVEEAPSRGIRRPPLYLRGVSELRRVEGAVTFRLISWSDKLPRYHFNIGRLDGPDLVLRGVAKPSR